MGKKSALKLILKFFMDNLLTKTELKSKKSGFNQKTPFLNG